MFDHRIDSANAIPIEVGEHLSPIYALLERLRAFADAGDDFAASHNRNRSGDARALALDYAAANSVTRRRFDALLREAELTGATGLELLGRRRGVNDPARIAAARFLGSELAASLRRLEKLIAPPAAA
jgi:hypothetical protein